MLRKISLRVLSLFTLIICGSGNTCDLGFSPFNHNTGTTGDDRRQFLVPTMNFSCSGRINKWSISVEATNAAIGLPGIVVQMWSVEENGCYRLKQESEYTKFAFRGDSMELMLNNSDAQMEFSPGNFVGYYVYEEGWSPNHDELSSNMTVLEFEERRSSYCVTGARSDNEEVDPSVYSYSPMITMEITTYLASSTSDGVSMTVSPYVSSPTSDGVITATDTQPNPTATQIPFQNGSIGIGIGLSVVGFILLLSVILLVVSVLLFCASRTKGSSSAARWRRSSSSLCAALSTPSSLNRTEESYAEVQSSMRRTVTKETNLEVYSTVDEEIGHIPNFASKDNDNSIYSEPRSPSSSVENPMYYVPSQSERETNRYSSLILGEVMDQEYSQLNLRTAPPPDTPSKIYSHLATEAFWEPPNHEDALYNTLSAKCFLEIPRSNILCKELIGSGAFGTVYQGTWKVGGNELEVGIKTVQDPSDHNATLNLLREAAVMGQFCHENIIKLYGVVSIGKPTMLVMELMEGKQLGMFLDVLDKTEDHRQLFLSFSAQIARGACYLEEKGFVHRDLAAHNILLNKECTMCKIADFGLSRVLAEKDYYSVNGGYLPLKWTSPEALLYRRHTHASDVWSFGMVLYEIWSVGGLPFEEWTLEEVIQGLQENYHHPIPETCPQDIYQIMLRCWCYDADKRPTFSELKEEFTLLLE